MRRRGPAQRASRDCFDQTTRYGDRCADDSIALVIQPHERADHREVDEADKISVIVSQPHPTFSVAEAVTL